MISETEHIRQIKRFHKKLAELDFLISGEEDKKKKGNLSFNYFKVHQLWPVIDNAAEKIKDLIDEIEKS